MRVFDAYDSEHKRLVTYADVVNVGTKLGYDTLKSERAAKTFLEQALGVAVSKQDQTECITPEIWVRWCRNTVVTARDKTASARELNEDDIKHFHHMFDLSLLP
jgi:hypothetical protein